MRLLKIINLNLLSSNDKKQTYFFRFWEMYIDGIIVLICENQRFQRETFFFSQQANIHKNKNRVASSKKF